MDTYLLDWANLLLRWAHVVVAIAWIGSSFYFVFLDNSLLPPKRKEDADAGIGGELWAIHGGSSPKVEARRSLRLMPREERRRRRRKASSDCAWVKAPVFDWRAPVFDLIAPMFDW